MPEEPEHHDEQGPTFAKKVDEDWKRAARAEKKKFAADAERRGEAASAEEEQTFLEFLSAMLQNIQIAMQRGAMEESRFLIDALSVLKKRTEGNLTNKEQTLLDTTLSELKRIYFQIASQTGAPTGGAPMGGEDEPAPTQKKKKGK